MPFRVFKTLLGKHRLGDSNEIADLDEMIRHGAERFAQWLAEQTGRNAPIAPKSAEILDEAIEKARRAENATGEISHQLASDCASFIGEVIRTRHGGEWEEDGLLGLVLRGPGGMPGAAAVPLAIAEKKWELGAQLNVARFFETLPDRFEKERRYSGYHAAPGPPPREIAGQLLQGDDAGAAASRAAGEFQAFWKQRFGIALPLSLQGVRESERFLRSHFFLFALHEETLVQMGLFLGEAGRGLFQGQWDFSELAGSHDPARAALVWPELPYYPVGRVYKLLIERPESASLDEYLRLIPSAREELRKRGG